MLPFFQSLSAVFLLAGLLVLTFLVIYLWFFAVAYFVNRKISQKNAEQPQTRFVFIVPAHNEEKDIAHTIRNLQEVNYPAEMFDLVVVADNCSDATAAKATEAGANCLERNDPDHRGKGYALRHAFAELLPQHYDAFVVIDADSIVSSDFLLRLDARLARGERVIQTYCGLSNPDAGILTYLFQVGSLIENKLFWAAKQIFGLPIILRGNGMCFSREVIEQHPWDAFSIVEDTEYGLKLVSNNVHIHFAEETGVYARQPETLDQAFAQRVRWASGNAGLTKGKALSMVLQGIASGNLNQADLGLSLIVGSKPLLLLFNLLLSGLAWAVSLSTFLCWSLLLLAAQLLYIGIGVLMNGINRQNFYRLIMSPFYLAWLCGVALLGMAGFRKNQWVRTNRSS